MDTVITFVLEHSLLNFFPLLLGLAAAILVIGPWLVRRGASLTLRTLIYSATAAATGVWSYSAMDVKNRAATSLELVVLWIGMLVIVATITAPFVYLRNKKRAAVGISAGT